MKSYLSGSFLALLFNINLTVFGISCKIIFIDAENFTHQGGWVIDEQSNGIMGSSYMLAHGLVTPVHGAEEINDVPAEGIYYIWIHTRHWLASRQLEGAPGKFLSN